jgi:hypothetical protein
MLVASGTPDREPERRMYVCPGCKTRIPFGTETSNPPDNCPKCRRRLYVPTTVGKGIFGRVRDARDADSDERTTAAIPNKTRGMGDKRKAVALALGRLARIALITFFVAFGIGCIGVAVCKYFELNDVHPAVEFLLLPLVLVLLSGPVYIASVFARDAIWLGALPWQLSLRTFLIAMTIIAVMLGVMGYLLGVTPQQ